MALRATICYYLECDNCGLAVTETYLDSKVLEEVAVFNLGWEQVSHDKWLCPVCSMPEPDPIDNFGYNPF